MAEKKYVPRLKEEYYQTVRDALQKQFGYANVNQIPKFEKIVVNMGVGEAATDAKAIDGAVSDLRTITGQQPLVTHARKSMAIPRIRDFRGISAKSFDGRGNFSMGVTEQLIFPEIDFDKIDHTRGMDITIVTTATTDEEGKALLQAFHFPFKQD